MRVLCACSLAIFMLATLQASAASTAPPYHWDGRLASGQTLEIENVNGPITVEAAAGDQLSVTAVRTADQSDPNSVQIRSERDASGILFCAVYPQDGDADQTCRHNGGRHYHDHGSGNNDTRVAFSVKLPASLAATLRTVNGSIDANGVASPIDAASVNGHVTVATSSYAQAKTVNGSIRVAMQSANWPSGGLEFASVNGGIDVTLPRLASAQVHAKTMHGSIVSAVPLSMRRSDIIMKYADGTIGSGKSSLTLTTLNGSIRLAQTP